MPTLTSSTAYVRIRPQATTGGHAQTGHDASAKMLQAWDDKSVTVGWRCSSNDDMGAALASGERYDYCRRVFGPEATQDDVYAPVVPPLIDKLLGCSAEAVLGAGETEKAPTPSNVMLFAYGQTGTGKSHTTLGPDGSLKAAPSTGGVDPRWGFFPRVVYDVFWRLRAAGKPFVVSFSAVEFYLGGACDLLNGSNPVALSSDHQPMGLAEAVLDKPEDVIPVLAEARSHRHNRHTRMNLATPAATGGDPAAEEHSGSSRGHGLFLVNVTQLRGAKMCQSVFYLVDLAGAERPEKTGAKRASGMECYEEMQKYFSAQKEGRDFELSIGAQGFAINFELYSLCDTALMATEYNKQKKGTGAPYRPSSIMMTDAVRIMGSCFGGAAHLSVIVTLSQAPQCGWETWFSCKYGRELSKLRAPVRTQPWRKVTDVVKALHETLADNEAALKRPIANKMVQWKRKAALAGVHTALMVVRELVLVAEAVGCGLGIDPHDPQMFLLPPAPTTGWSFDGSSNVQESQLQGRWDQRSLAAYLKEEFPLNDVAIAKEFLKTPIRAMRRMIDKQSDVLHLNPVNRAWLARCPAESVPLVIDTSVFAPCDNEALTVFVHRPEGVTSRNRPAVVYTHGGGGIFLRASHMSSLCARMAIENDVTVFNVEYRLAPENKAPAGIMDAVGVVLYVRQHASELGVDGSRIAITGESGGGYIAAGAAMELARRGMGGVIKLCVPQAPQVSDIIVRGPPDEVNPPMEGGESSKLHWRWVEKQLSPAASSPYAGHAHYVWINRAPPGVLAAFPPTVIITSEFDLCRRMAEDFARLLVAAGAPLRDFVVHPGTNHAWWCDMTHPRSPQYWAGLKDLFAQHLL